MYWLTHIRSSCCHQRVFQRRCVRGTQVHPMSICAYRQGRSTASVAERRINHSLHALPSDFEANLDAPMPVAVHEVLGAIDGINDPRGLG